jgi:hypothetical protein
MVKSGMKTLNHPLAVFSGILDKNFRVGPFLGISSSSKIAQNRKRLEISSSAFGGLLKLLKPMYNIQPLEFEGLED